MTQAPWQRGLAAVLDAHTRLLVLGSFPSEASLAAQQYYAHPRNQFWPLLGALFGESLTTATYAERLAAVRARGLGIWDVHARCRRPGSLDSAIEASEPNDLAAALRSAPRLAAIAHNGGESARSMKLTRSFGLPVWRLPSTSPANASWSFERKLAAWREVFVSAGLL